MNVEQRIYTEIAQELADQIPMDWTSIKLIVQYGVSQWSHVGWYKPNSDSEWVSYDCDLSFFSLRTWLKDLKTYTTANNFTEWNTFEFQVNENGKFSIDYTWDQEYQDDVDG